MNILAIDTSSKHGLVALKISPQTITSRENFDPFEHNRFILPAIDSLLTEAKLKLTDIDYFAASVGPGSFVGTRLAVTVTQGLAFGAKKPVIAVSHLALMAESLFDGSAALEVTVILDAKMQGFYQAHFHRHTGMIGPEQFLKFDTDTPAFSQCPPLQGRWLIKLAEAKITADAILPDPALLQPVYLQDESNWKKQIK